MNVREPDQTLLSLKRQRKGKLAMLVKLKKLVDLYNKFKEQYPELTDALTQILSKILFPVQETVFSASDNQAVADFEAECRAIIEE